MKKVLLTLLVLSQLVNAQMVLDVAYDCFHKEDSALSHIDIMVTDRGEILIAHNMIAFRVLGTAYAGTGNDGNKFSIIVNDKEDSIWLNLNGIAPILMSCKEKK